MHLDNCSKIEQWLDFPGSTTNMASAPRGPRTSETNADIKAMLKVELNDTVHALEALLAPHPAAYAGGLALLTREDCEAYKEAHHIDHEQDDEEDTEYWQAVSENSMPNFAARMQRVMELNSAKQETLDAFRQLCSALREIQAKQSEIQAKQKESERQMQATLEAIRSELVTLRGGRAQDAAACEAGTSASGASKPKRQRPDEVSRGVAANILRTAVGRGSGAKGPPGFERSAFDDEGAENVDEQTNTCIKVNDPSSARHSAMLLAYKLQTDRATQVRFYMSNYLQPWLFLRRTHSMPDRKEILVKLIEHMAEEQKPLVSKNELDEVDADDLLGWAELLINSDEQLKKEFENLESAAWQAFGLRAKALVLDNMPMAMRGNILDGFSAHSDSLLASAKYEQLDQLLRPLQNLARMPLVEEDGGADDEAQEAAPGQLGRFFLHARGSVQSRAPSKASSAWMATRPRSKSSTRSRRRCSRPRDRSSSRTASSSRRPTARSTLSLSSPRRCTVSSSAASTSSSARASRSPSSTSTMPWTSRQRLGHRTRASCGSPRVRASAPSPPSSARSPPSSSRPSTRPPRWPSLPRCRHAREAIMNAVVDTARGRRANTLEAKVADLTEQIAQHLTSHGSLDL